jgi:hypothetical protein
MDNGEKLEFGLMTSKFSALTATKPKLSLDVVLVKTASNFASADGESYPPV